MLSQVMLCKIDQRLRQAKNCNNPFGGISVILIGDPGQLLPVGGSPLYDKKLKSNLAQGGFIAYQKFKNVVILESVMMQQNQEQAHFMELIPRLRNGQSTLADYELLLTRIPTENNKNAFKNAIRIFNDNESVDKYNIEKLIDLKTPINETKANNSSKKAQNSPSSDFGGLVNSVFLSVGSNITLTANTWIRKGFYFTK